MSRSRVIADPKSRPVIDNVIGMVAGVLMIGAGYGIQFNNIDYPPGDYRGDPSYGRTSFAIAAVLGTFAFTVCLIRLVRGFLSRR